MLACLLCADERTIQMKKVNKGMKKHVFLVVLLLIALVAAAGCEPGTTKSAKARILIDTSNRSVLLEEINRVNGEQTAGGKDNSPLASPTYQIIVDGNLGALTNWGSREAGDYGTGNGFLDRKCTTYDSLMLLLSEITSGEKTYGYFSCEWGEAAALSDTEKASGALEATCFRYDAAFSADSTSAKYYLAHKNIAYLVNEIAATAAKRANSNNVYIFVSDLAMQNEGQSTQIADALAKYVVANDSLTMSLIGIQADYVGMINNMPRTSIGIEPKRVFGEPLNTGKVFQRYLYLLIIGKPEQVYETTNQIVEKCAGNRNLSRAGQVNSVYFSGLECVSCQEAGSAGLPDGMTQTAVKPSLAFCGNILAYGAEEKYLGYLYALQGDEKQEETNAITSIPFAKIYSGAPSPTDANIRVTCQFPFILRGCLKQTGMALADDGATFLFSQYSPTVSILEAKQLDLKVKSNGMTADIVGWSECAPGLVTLSGEPILDAEKGTFQAGLTVDTSALERDKPLLLSVTIQPSFLPDRSELLKAFGAGWLTVWSMDMKQYNQDWDAHAFTFSQATNTAYLAETFLNNLLGRQIDRNIEDATAEMSGYKQTLVFGIVQHDKASAYVEGVAADKDLGWAFSQNEVDAFPKQ